MLLSDIKVYKEMYCDIKLCTSFIATRMPSSKCDLLLHSSYSFPIEFVKPFSYIMKLLLFSNIQGISITFKLQVFCINTDHMSFFSWQREVTLWFEHCWATWTFLLLTATQSYKTHFSGAQVVGIFKTIILSLFIPSH